METTWSVSPCSDCVQSPCCHYLPVQKKSFDTKDDLEFALDILNHQYIELGLYDRGYWMIYYYSQCHYYDIISTKCRIHEQELQPQVCKDYKAVHCWYKKAFSASQSKSMIRFNRRRMAWLIKACSYDETGEIVGVPSWDLMLSRLTEIPLKKKNPLVERPEAVLSLQDFDPAKGLVFEYSVPQTQSQWALMNFRMNFNGVTLFQDQNRWLMHLYAPIVQARYRSHIGKTVAGCENLARINTEQFNLLYHSLDPLPENFTRH